MVAVIKTGHSIRGSVSYNENKVKEGVAECIHAGNYPIDTDQLSFNQKLNRLINQAALNENVSRNSVHISLNFHPDEKLSKEQLKEIAEAYMQKIGFGDQPYLVYRHFDAGHPHIHLVSVKVRTDGSRIDTHNIGRNQSEKARKEIEMKYDLIRASGKKMKPFENRPALRVLYGKSDSRRAVAHVLETVLDKYNYTSIPELNAVLKLWNVMADRGEERSRVHRNKGLVYRILDAQGNKIGVPIKASSFHNKPTLKYLEERFRQNESNRESLKAGIKNAIDLSFYWRPKQSFQELLLAVEKEGIKTVVRKNPDGVVYGLTYIDFNRKCVFNGSDLGKQYSAKGILERCTTHVYEGHLPQVNLPKTASLKSERPERDINKEKSLAEKITDDLIKPMDPEKLAIPPAHELIKRRKKKWWL